MKRALVLGAPQLIALAREFGTPLYVYDAATMRARVRQLAGFDLVRYAQKANPNLSILTLLRGLGVAIDAVSSGEIVRALRAGYEPDEIAFTADLFDASALEWIASRRLRVNCGSLDMLPALAAARAGAEVVLRVNPGFGHGHDARVSTGGEASKHGIWHEQLDLAIETARSLGLCVSGLHVHIGSGSNLENLTLAAGVFESAAPRLRDSLRSLSAGGGLPVPYREGEPAFDIASYTTAWQRARDRASDSVARRLTLEVEPGRYLLAESGVLLTEVRGKKQNGTLDYTLVDAGFNSLLRPAMYGAYHRIEALTFRTGEPRPTVVAGPLCESGDVFTRTKDAALDPRRLPELGRGDLLAICDVGAYGMSMASRYNSQPLPAEVLVDNGVARLIRRRESLDEIMDHELRL